MYTTCCEDKTGNTDKCYLPIVNMVDEDMTCDQSDKVVYRARIIGTRSLSPGKILEYIDKWVSSSDSQISVYEGRTNDAYNMDIDKACPVYLPSPTDPHCIPPQAHVIDINNVMLLIVIVIMMSSMTIVLLVYVINLIRTRIKYDSYKNKLNKI